MKKKVTVTVYDREDYGSGLPPTKANEFVAWLREKLFLIPGDCMHTAKVELETYSCCGDYYAGISISYERDETEEEAMERQKNEMVMQELKRASEIKEYFALKEKYGF